MRRSDPIERYVHRPLAEEIQAIGGRYLLEKEFRLSHRGEEILVLIGYGVFDSTCCGIGGCRYALVPGFVRGWRSATDEQGHPVTPVEPVAAVTDRDEIESMVKARETVQTVQFW